MHAVLTTPTFDRQAEKIGLTDDEVVAMCSFLAANPTAGDVVAGTSGCRKIRFAGRGKGKSGGYRTIHFVSAEDVPIFLLAVISKGDRGNISKGERNELAKLVPTLASAYMKAQRR